MVTIVEAVDTAIVSQSESKAASIVYEDSSFMPLFAKSIQELTLEQRLNMRNNLIAQLANSKEVPEAINHVL